MYPQRDRTREILATYLLTFVVILVSGEAVKLKRTTFDGLRQQSTDTNPAQEDGQYSFITNVSKNPSNKERSPLIRLSISTLHRPRRRRPRDERFVRDQRFVGTSWTEWGACNASCGVGFEKREGGCSFGECMGRQAVEWRGCIGIKCDEKKRRRRSATENIFFSQDFLKCVMELEQRWADPAAINKFTVEEYFHRRTSVLSVVMLVTGFLGGVLLTTVYLKTSWILDKIKGLVKRNPGKSKKTSKIEKASDDISKRPPLNVSLKYKEPSYVDVRELNTNMENYFAITNNDENCEDGYLIPGDKTIGSNLKYYEPTSEPEYIDVIE